MAFRAAMVGSGLVALAAINCSSASDPSTDQGTSEAISTPARNWSAHPAIVEIDTADEIYAVSDIHGHYDEVTRLLAANHLIAATNADPTKVKWTGGAAILVVTGDLIDKGTQSLETIDLMRTLQDSAPHSGGRVIVTLGNHEAEFLADPRNDKATSTGEDKAGIDTELASANIEPEALVHGKDPGGRGAWLANLPFAVRIKKWFFAHAGNTSKMSVADLATKLQSSVDHHGYGDKDITGKDSVLEAQNWYGKDDDNAGTKEADALGVKHIAFGHDPGALDDHGRIRFSKNNVLVKLDTAMGIQNATGRAFLLHVKTKGTDAAEALDESGHATNLL